MRNDRLKTRLATDGVGKGTKSPKQRERDRRRDIPEGHGRRDGFAEVLSSSFPAARSFGGSTMARCALAPISQVKLLESFCNIVLRDTVNVRSRANFRLNKSAIYSLDHAFHLYLPLLYLSNRFQPDLARILRASLIDYSIFTKIIILYLRRNIYIK